MRGALWLTVMMAWVSGCAEVTDLGIPCTLVKRGPADGGTFTAVKILEKEIKGSKDFISFGSAECEDSYCVRDINHPRGDDNAEAMGYCSRVCLPSTPNACPSADSADDSIPERRLSCRALLLDQATLTAICQSTPADCQKYFNGVQAPYFCARGGSLDGGSP